MSEVETLRKELKEAQAKNDNLIDRNARLLTLAEQKEKEIFERKNLNFVQLYKTELKNLRALVRLNPTAAQILFVLVEKMNKQNAVVMSFKTLEQITKRTRQTCSKAIKDLKAANFINVIKVGSVNAYVVNSNVFWATDNQSKEKFAMFTATVVACGSEQDQDFEDWSNVKLKSIPIIAKGEQITLFQEGDE